MAQTRVVIPESPSPTYSLPRVLPPWHYRETIRPSLSRGSRASASSSHSHSHSRTIPVCPSPKRTRTTGGTSEHHHRDGPHHTPHPPHHQHHHYPRTHSHSHSHSHHKEGRKPWDHMAQTYAWVLEQEIAEMARKNEETVRWIVEQQEREAREHAVFAMMGLEHRYRELMEQLVDDFEDMAEQLKMEGELRRNAMFWQREREREAYDDMRRHRYAEWQHEADEYRTAYLRRKEEAEAKERARRELERQRAKAARDAAEGESWRKYEDKWAALSPSAEPPAAPLTFKTIPWPMFSPPSKAENITPARVAMFILSPNHSEDVTRKDRIKNALRRWHPDRFGRILARVAEDEKKEVEEGVGIVVRCLNSLMERESKMITQTTQNH